MTATLLALQALAVAAVAVAWGRSWSRLRSRWALGCALLIVVFPPLVVAYAATVPGWAWWHQQGFRQGLYLLLLTIRAAALATLLLVALPGGGDTPSARWWLARHAGGWARWQHRLRSSGPQLATVLILVWLTAFAEFDLASRLAVTREVPLNWSVRLFDLRAAGMDLGTLWVRLLPLFAIQLLLVAAACVGLQRLDGRSATPLPSATVWSLAAVGAVALSVAAPLLLLIYESLVGWPSLVRNLGLGRHLPASLVIALVAAGLAVLVATRVRRAWSRLLVLLPGLVGALVLALTMQAALAAPLPGLASVASGPFPAILGVTCLVLPVAVLGLARPYRPSTAWHCCDHSRAPLRLLARCWWSERGRWLFWVWSLCFAIAMGEVVLTSALAPPGFQPALVLLYNHMHYGHTAVLSARVLVFVLVTLIVIALAAPAMRWSAVLLLRRGWR